MGRGLNHSFFKILMHSLRIDFSGFSSTDSRALMRSFLSSSRATVVVGGIAQIAAQDRVQRGEQVAVGLQLLQEHPGD